MYVTVTCFKQLTVTVHETEEHPISIGLLLIHTTHDNCDHKTNGYFHHLKLKFGTNLAKLLIRSDEEQAMVNATIAELLLQIRYWVLDL